MVEKRTCSFCGQDIEPGTGKMYVKKDGTVYNFCSNKCKKNRIDIGRVPRRTRWTNRYSELKSSSLRRGETKASIKADDKMEKEASDSKKSASKKKAASSKKGVTASKKKAKKEKPAKKKAPAKKTAPKKDAEEKTDE